MQICLSQQSLSPSHHFLHSNAVSHLYKIPLSATSRGGARFVDLHFAISARFALSSEEMHDGHGVLHALLCTFYYQESAETIKKKKKKMDAPGDLLSSRWITLPLCFQQEAVRPCERSVGWIGKVNVFFFPLSLRYKPYSVIPRHGSSYPKGVRLLFCLPSPQASFPGFDALVWFSCLKATIQNLGLSLCWLETWFSFWIHLLIFLWYHQCMKGFDDLDQLAVLSL